MCNMSVESISRITDGSISYHRNVRNYKNKIVITLTHLTWPFSESTWSVHVSLPPCHSSFRPRRHCQVKHVEKRLHGSHHVYVHRKIWITRNTKVDDRETHLHIFCTTYPSSSSSSLSLPLLLARLLLPLLLV